MTSKRLQRLVHLKRLVEQSRAAELRRKQQDLEDAQRAAQATADALRTLDETLDEDGGTATPEGLLLVHGYQQHLARTLQQQQEEAARTADGVEEEQGRVREAWQERRVMENVRDRAQEKESEAELSSERKTSDSLALQAYRRLHGGGGKP